MTSGPARACLGVWMTALGIAFYALPAYAMFTWAAIGLSGAVAVLVGVHLHRPARRLPWYLLSAVLVLFTSGDTSYSLLTDYLHHDEPFPSIADVFYLLVYPVLAVALLIFVRFRSGGDNRAALLDALVPTAGLGLLSWVFWIAPYVRDTELDVGEKLVSVSYPIGDVLALAMLLRLLTASGRKPVAGTILAAGVTGLLLTDVIYGQRQLNGTWAVGGPTDAGWMFFYAAVGFAALHPSMARLTESAQNAPEEASGRRLYFMSAAALIAPAVLFFEHGRGAVRDAPVIAGFSAFMFLLVMVRLGGLLATQRLSVSRERALREAGAMLVAAASEKDAAEAIHQAVAKLMPADVPFRLAMGGADVTGPDDDPEAGRSATLVRVDDLPPAIADQLTGFDVALHTAVVVERVPGTPGRRKIVCLSAAEPVLRMLLPSFQGLISQGVMAIERINLTDEVNRRTSEDYFRTLIQSASDVILIVDDDNRIRYASPSADAVLGRADLLGTHVAGLIAEDDYVHLHDTLSRIRLGRGRHEGVDLVAVRADGRLLQIECGIRDLRADPTVAGMVLTIRDVTERQRLETDLAHQAFHDGLTGLANRVLFQNRLEHAFVLAERDHSTVGVLFVDLDDFKVVNDTLGHTLGDQLLIAVGQRIVQAIGPLNTAARMGGDEFAVLVEKAQSPEDADEVAARIVAALAVPVEVGDGHGGSHVVSGAASVGVATSREARTTTELQRQADLALYVAKGEGKNNWQRYRSELHTAMVERLELRSALTEAVAGGQLRLQYQPIVDLPTEVMVGAEALVRWEHPTRGMIPPVEFIDLAEENGAIVEIGTWVLRESLRTFVEWRAAAPLSTLRYISVNVSARQFRTSGFVDEVRRALADTGARPECLLLEITESLLLRDADQVWADLGTLREMGIRIAIDDFGTGYSSLSYLRQMPVDVLKIDKSFIDDILHSDQQRALVQAIVSLADNLDLAVVAEGIEEGAHQQQLLAMGCPYGQGYHFSRPVDAAQVSTWISGHALVV